MCVLQDAPCWIALGLTLRLLLECGTEEMMWHMECTPLGSTGKDHLQMLLPFMIVATAPAWHHDSRQGGPGECGVSVVAEERWKLTAF